MFGPSWTRPAVRLGAWLILATLWPAAAHAQQPSAATLTLEEALALARRHNPDYLSQRNDGVDADWAVREAYGQLLPSALASSGMQYQAAGSQRFGIFTAEDIGFTETSSYLLSDYYLGLSYQVGGATLLRPGRERASRRATEASLEAADFNLTADVTRQYLAVLRARAAIRLAREELARAQENEKLANARVAVGAATLLEQKQAAVERGRAEVALVQAEAQQESERLRLSERLGVELPAQIELTSTFAVFDLPWTKEDLLGRALDRHPQLRALRATEEASSATVRMAKSAYLPTLELSAGWSGFTREARNSNFLLQQARDQSQSQAQTCDLLNRISAGLKEPLPGTPADCTQFQLTSAQEAEILQRNDVFPFNFTRQPFGMQVRVSLPIFSGFTRERQVEAAKVAAQDARYRLRAQELQLRTQVAGAYLNLTTAHQTVALEEKNAEVGEEQLRLARERYRIGAASFLELKEAETLKARADRSYVSSLYAFHEALAVLEAAVGIQLRAEEQP